MYTDGTVTFTGTLANLTGSPVTVSAFDIGNITVNRYAFNSVALLPQSKDVQLFRDPLDYQALPSNTYTLAAAGQPGSSVSFPIRQLNSIIWRAGQVPMVKRYSTPTSSGTVSIVFTYQYASAPTGTYAGAVLSNQVTFNVH